MVAVVDGRRRSGHLHSHVGGEVVAAAVVIVGPRARPHRQSLSVYVVIFPSDYIKLY